MRTLDVVVRTHNTSNVHTDRSRYSGFDKTTLILGCLNSLVLACNRVLDWKIKFQVLDDHSTCDLFPGLDEIFSRTNFPAEIIRLEHKGYNYSALKQFEYCRSSGADLVYSVEDDYLHSPPALSEMLASYDIFKQKMNQEVCIYPFDMPDDYEPPWLEPCYLVHGSDRHWRTGTWTTNTLMCSPSVFQNHWALFEKLALGYNPSTHEVHEGNTICKIWRDHVPRFSPVPSLVLHMQFDTQRDPFIDWRSWWQLQAGAAGK